MCRTTDQLPTSRPTISTPQRSTVDTSERSFTISYRQGPIWVKGSRVQISPTRPKHSTPSDLVGPAFNRHPLPDALGQQRGQVVEEEIVELGRSAEGAVGRAVLVLQPGQHLLEPGMIGVSRAARRRVESPGARTPARPAWTKSRPEAGGRAFGSALLAQFWTSCRSRSEASYDSRINRNGYDRRDGGGRTWARSQSQRAVT